MSVLDLSRVNRGPLGRWWWTIDQWILFSILLLMGVGIVLILAASPSVAHQHTWTSLYFIKRHLMIIAPCFLILVGVSLCDPKNTRRIALALFIVSLVLLIRTFWAGIEIKGARRWLSLSGFIIQPSEFAKPALAVLCGWLFAESKRKPLFPGTIIALGLYVVILIPVFSQPDVGTSILITIAWLSQLFLSGLSLLYTWILAVAGLVCLLGAYLFFPHVSRRINLFFSPGVTDRFGEQFQVLQSLEAFAHGGLWGTGPGEGTVKRHLPDAHADFIFAVAGEEFGLLFCIFILALYGLIVFRCIKILLKREDLFIILATTGLLVQFGTQALINMASTLSLMPSKGTTLPFISYGGSSLLSLSLGMGMLLGLTRRRVLGEKD